jgi:hypothetical protein
MVIAAMTEMIAMTEGIETGVMTGMTTVTAVVMAMAKTRVATAKEEINSVRHHRLTGVTDQEPHSAIQRRRLFF